MHKIHSIQRFTDIGSSKDLYKWTRSCVVDNQEIVPPDATLFAFWAVPDLNWRLLPCE